MHIEERWGEKVINNLSIDLQNEMPNATGFSRRNIYYCKQYYLLYYQLFESVPQAEAQSEVLIVPQVEAQLKVQLFSVPWGHHKYIIDKCSNNPQKALFYVHQTMENGWSRAMLLNFLDTDLYERDGKALTNFKRTLPEETSDLAQEITKDPYNFAFTGITKKYNERVLKDALLQNITQFLIELGTGFAYVGKEYRLKIGEFDFADAGQLGGYVVACNHLLRKEGRDNPTIGLLVCKYKNNLLAQYALESSNQPIGISEYELAKLYPEKVEGTIPTIEEIEEKLSEQP